MSRCTPADPRPRPVQPRAQDTQKERPVLPSSRLDISQGAKVVKRSAKRNATGLCDTFAFARFVGGVLVLLARSLFRRDGVLAQCHTTKDRACLIPGL